MEEKTSTQSAQIVFYANLPIDDVRMSVPQNDEENDGS